MLGEKKDPMKGSCFLNKKKMHAKKMSTNCIILIMSLSRSVLHTNIFIKSLHALDFSLTYASGYLCTFTLPVLAGICGVGFQMKMFAAIISIWDCVYQASIFKLKADAFSWKAVSQHGGHYHCSAPFV